MVKRRNYNGKEQDKLQKMLAENKRLKAQVSKLRKVIKNIDIEHYKFVQDLLNSDKFVDNTAEIELQKKLEEKWACFTCGKGVMRLVMLNRAGIPHYIRKCDICDNKTKMKKYTEDVEGV